MKKKEETKKADEPEDLSRDEFKDAYDFRKIEVVFFKSCSLCQHSRLIKNPSKLIKYDLLVCTMTEPAFVVDASTVCDLYK